MKVDPKYEKNIVYNDTYTYGQLKAHLYKIFDKMTIEDVLDLASHHGLLNRLTKAPSSKYRVSGKSDEYYQAATNQQIGWKEAIHGHDIKRIVNHYVDRMKDIERMDSGYTKGTLSRQENKTFPAAILWLTLKHIYHFGGKASSLAHGDDYAGWNKAFRDLGIYGFVDVGQGIIHIEEMSQAVFFDTEALDIVYYLEGKRYKKK